jgi:hypothetical protein
VVVKKHLKPDSRGSFVKATSTEELLSRQSVRATFRLSSGTIEAINIVVTQLGIKPKSLFDHLLEDIESIQKVGSLLQQYPHAFPDRVQKTFVISKKSLSFLDDISRQYHASRDILVESLVRRLLPVISEEKKKHQTRKQILGKIKAHFQEGGLILDDLARTLGRYDPLYSNMLSAMAGYNKAFTKMAALVEKGRIIEEFSTSQMVDILAELQSKID